MRDAVKALKPKYLCLENVKAMVTKKFVGMFNLWQLELERLGYRNFVQVLNAKDYGVPQNRERIFLVSIRDDGDLPRFFFPQPFPLERRLKDVLEDNVDEKYYLSDKMLDYFNRVDADKTHGHNFTPKGDDDTASTIRTAPGNRVDDNFVECWDAMPGCTAKCLDECNHCQYSNATEQCGRLYYWMRKEGRTPLGTPFPPKTE